MRNAHLSKLVRIVTNSERTEFACQRRWWFRYHEGLSTDDAVAPLRMGSLWHHALACWYRSGCRMTPAEVSAAVVDPWLERRLEWLDGRLGMNNAAETADEDREHARLTRGMLDGYVAQFASDMDDFEVIAVEPQVARWMHHPVTGKLLRDRVELNGKRVFRQWAFGGAMDLLVRMKDGSVWFMEHKTTAESDLDHYVRKLDWDPQIRGYAWAAGAPIAGSDVREPVTITGVIYNVARKKVPVEPEPLKNGGLSKAKGIDTTRAHYLNAVLRNGLNPDAYADVLEQLKSKKFFHRDSYVFTGPELEDFQRDTAHTALAIMAAERAAYHPRQTRVCIGTAVAPCPFKQVCIDDGAMMRKAYAVQGIRHAELTGDLAEPYVAQLRNVRLPIIDPATAPPTLEDQLRASIDTNNQLQSSPTSLTMDPFSE